MKKATMFSGLLLALILVVWLTHLPEQLLLFYFLGIIPYTQISVPPMVMFFAWLLLPLIIFSGTNFVKGLYILTLLVAEQVEYTVKEYADSHPKKRVSSKKRPTTLVGSIQANFAAVSKNLRKKFKHLPKQRYGKISELHEA